MKKIKDTLAYHGFTESTKNVFICPAQDQFTPVVTITGKTLTIQPDVFMSPKLIIDVTSPDADTIEFISDQLEFFSTASFAELVQTLKDECDYDFAAEFKKALQTAEADVFIDQNKDQLDTLLKDIL